ncbi:hypothetical protein HJG60_008959 [Phyllostomus discolor]|uniref:Uncharacterized protein n=1 Tax=Phyllostomus discolor TaxID=89673 RepID=A0A833YZW7_9CHIR|nr:hypothetical protein HJG60_008959 [Phyllostomus discolor]
MQSAAAGASRTSPRGCDWPWRRFGKLSAGCAGFILSAPGAENKVLRHAPLPMKAFDRVFCLLSVKNCVKLHLFITLSVVTGELHFLSVSTDAVARSGQSGFRSPVRVGQLLAPCLARGFVSRQWLRGSFMALWPAMPPCLARGSPSHLWFRGFPVAPCPACGLVSHMCLPCRVHHAGGNGFISPLLCPWRPRSVEVEGSGSTPVC